MRFCQSPWQPIRHVTCSYCREANRCAKFKSWYVKNFNFYMDYVEKQLQLNPEKYKLEVVMGSPARKNLVMIVGQDGSVEKIIDAVKLNNLSTDAARKLAGKRIFKVNGEMEAIVTIKFVNRAIKEENFSEVAKSTTKKRK